MDISAIILAGGQGRRFGHCDKGLVKWQGRWMIEHVIARLAPQVERIIISCNRNLDQYRSLGFPVIADRINGFIGPLAGIDAALELCDTTYALIVPCDSPVLPHTLAETLYKQLCLHSDSNIAVAHDGERQQHLIALWKVQESKAALKAFLESGGQAVKEWYKTQKTISVDFSDDKSSLVNINTQNELDRLDLKTTAPGMHKG